MTIRYPYLFESDDGAIAVQFGTAQLEYDQSQDYRVASAPLVGADYQHDFLGVYQSPKENGVEVVRWMIIGVKHDDYIEDAFDELASKIDRIGRGKLWTIGTRSDRRWCSARPVRRPVPIIGAETVNHMPVECEFARFSDWYGETLQTGSTVISSTPHAFEITNPGNARVRNAIFRLRSSGATGFTNPSLVSSTAGLQLVSSRDAQSVDSELRIDCGQMRVEYSNDNGSTYVDDYDKVTIPATQVVLMDIEPGLNSFTYSQDSGTPNATLEWSFYAAYS